MSLGSRIQIVRGMNWVIGQYETYIQHRNLEAEREALHKITDIPLRIREGSWSASAQGSCLRMQQFTYLGKPAKAPDDKLANIFANGDFVHLRHQAFGMVAGYVTATEVPIISKEYQLRGTMDGMLSNGRGFEIKSINNYGFDTIKTFGAKPEHKRQVHAYMLLTGLDAFHILYENKADNLLKEYVITREQGMIDEIKADLDQLNEATEKKKLLPMLQECKNMTGRFNTCPFAQICERATWDA